MDRSPEGQWAFARFSADLDGLLAAGARVVATQTHAAAAVLYAETGRLRLAALHDDRPERAELLRSLLSATDLNDVAGPFAITSASGRNSLLDIPVIALRESGQWAHGFDAAGVATLGLTALRAGERGLGVLLTMRLVGDPGMSAEDLGRQARLAGQLAASLDTAATLRHLRNFGFLVDALPDAIIGFGREREVILWNNGAERMYAIPQDEALGHPLDELVATEWAPAQSASGFAGPGISLINRGAWTGRVRQRSSTGRVLYADVSIASVVEDGLLRGAVSINRDISDLVTAELQRGQQDRRVQAVLDASTACQAVLDASGLIVMVNSAWATARDSRIDDPPLAGVGVDYPALLRGTGDEPSVAGQLADGISAVLGGRTAAWGGPLGEAGALVPTAEVRALPGSQGGALVTIGPLRSQVGAVVAPTATSAHTQPGAWLSPERLRAATDQALATGAVVGAIQLRLPELRALAEALGAGATDQLRQAIGRRLASFPRATLLANPAADEFTVVVPGTHARALRALADEFVEVASATLSISGGEVSLPVRLGLACSTDLPSPAVTASALINAANAALSGAEREGKVIGGFDEQLRADLARRAELVHWRDALLPQGQLRVAYASQFRCSDGQLRGAAALVRWHHPQAGLIPDEELDRLATDSTTIIPIGSWLLAEACSHASLLIARRGGDFTISVRTSRAQLRDPRFPQVVHEALRSTGLAPEQVMLEAPAPTALRELRALGVGLCLVDTGEGLPSPTWWAEAGVKEVRLPPSLTRDLERDERARGVVTGLVRLGQALDVRIVATCLPTPSQLRLLRDLGVSAYQSEADVPDWVSRQDPTEQTQTDPSAAPRPRRAS